MMNYNHPLIKEALEHVQKYADKVDSIIEIFKDSFEYATFTFDFELLNDLKKDINETLSLIENYLLDQDQKYKKLHKILKIFRVYDDSKYLVLLWDFKRPIIYRAQKLNELLESIDKIFT